MTGPPVDELVPVTGVQLSHLTKGRINVNIASGWFRGEFQAIGEPWLDHDERYRRSEELMRAIRGIWSENKTSGTGQRPVPLV